MSTPDTVINKSPISKDKSSKRPARRRQQRQVICQVCHRGFAELTAEHLRSHGFTLTRYRRAFSASTRGLGGQTGSVGLGDDPNTLTVLDIAQRIVTDPQVIRDLAGEVSEAIFSTSLREQLRLALVSTIAQRLDAHGKASAALNEVRSELTERWRIAQGGLNGQPTPTKDLVSIHQALNVEIRQTEDLLSKTVKMAIDEFRSQKGNVSIGGGLDPTRFSGTGEALPIPAAVGPSDREAMRQLWGMFDSAITAQRTINAEVIASDSPADDLQDGPLAEVLTESSEDLPNLTEPDDVNSDSGPVEYDEPF